MDEPIQNPLLRALHAHLFNSGYCLIRKENGFYPNELMVMNEHGVTQTWIDNGVMTMLHSLAWFFNRYYPDDKEGRVIAMQYRTFWSDTHARSDAAMLAIAHLVPSKEHIEVINRFLIKQSRGTEPLIYGSPL